MFKEPCFLKIKQYKTSSLLSFFLFCLLSFNLNAQITSTTREYEERYDQNLIGNFMMIGNTNLDCAEPDPSDCPTSPVTNNGVEMGYYNADTVNGTVNSSMANLNLPAGATVTFAGLYWGGVNASSLGTIDSADTSLSMDVVKLRIPGSTTYTNVNATVRDIENAEFNFWSTYMAFANITTQVQAGGTGDYYVADIMSVTGTGFTGPHNGWTMVVVYEVDGELSRRINVWDGLKFFGVAGGANNPSDMFTVTGLDTPASGAFETHVGYFAMDGEGSSTGDFVQVNGSNVSNALNPANNTLNGTISTFGVNNANRNPNFDYNWAIDVDVFDASGDVPNGASSANINLGSTSEGLWGGVFVISNEIAIPRIVKTISPETIRLNETSTVTLEITNPSEGVAITGVNITDQMPSGMQLAPIPNASSTCGATSSNIGGDTSITFTGGSLAPGVTCTYTFDVVVTAIGNYNNVVPNTPADFSNDQNLALVNEGEDNLIVLNIVEANPDSGSIVTGVGGVVIPNVLTNDNLAGTIPPSISDVNLTQVSTSNSGVTLNTTTGAVSVTTSTPPGTYAVVYQICEKVEPTNCETATATVVVTPRVDLSLIKTVNTAIVKVGNTIIYTLTVKNDGGADATGVQVTDVLPTGVTYVSDNSATISTTYISDVWNIGDLDANQTITLQITATVNGAGTIVNTAEVTQGNPLDEDSTPNNGN